MEHSQSIITNILVACPQKTLYLPHLGEFGAVTDEETVLGVHAMVVVWQETEADFWGL